MFWEHIETDSRMCGMWLYFGMNDNLLGATLALLPKWTGKEEKLRKFHNTLMDKQKCIYAAGEAVLGRIDKLGDDVFS